MRGSIDRTAETRSLHYFVLIGAQLAVGAAALMARAGLDAGMSALALSAWRLTVASLVLFFVLYLQRPHIPAEVALDARTRARLLAAGACLGLHFATWFASLQIVPVARSTLLVATAPVWAGVAGVALLRHRLPRAFWVGLAVAAVGAYLVTQGAGHRVSLQRASPAPALLGDALAVLGAILVAAYLLLVEDLQDRFGTWRVVAWTYSSAAIAVWPLVFLSQGADTVLPRSTSAWLSVLGMALIPQLLGHTALNWSLKQFPAGVVAAATLLEPAFAGALAWILLREPLSGRQLIGAAILLCGVALAVIRRKS